jgi:hypothetical protein
MGASITQVKPAEPGSIMNEGWDTQKAASFQPSHPSLPALALTVLMLIFCVLFRLWVGVGPQVYSFTIILLAMQIDLLQQDGA